MVSLLSPTPSPTTNASGATASRRALIQMLPRRGILIVIGAVLAAGVVWLVFAHPLMTFLTLVGLIVLPNKYYAWQHKKRIALIDSQVPDMLVCALVAWMLKNVEIVWLLLAGSGAF